MLRAGQQHIFPRISVNSQCGTHSGLAFLWRIPFPSTAGATSVVLDPIRSDVLAGVEQVHRLAPPGECMDQG